MSDLFTNLFEFLPEAEHLLSLEPEELAGPLLLSLEDIERIIPGNIIGYDQLSGAIERQAGIKYPMGCRGRCSIFTYGSVAVVRARSSRCMESIELST